MNLSTFYVTIHYTTNLIRFFNYYLFTEQTCYNLNIDKFQFFDFRLIYAVNNVTNTKYIW